MQELELKMGNVPIWLLIQSGDGKYGDLDEQVKNAFLSARPHPPNDKQTAQPPNDKQTAQPSNDKQTIQLPSGEPIVLLIDSLGGSAKSAYQLANLFKRYCGGFSAVVPRRAKSAATLLALGAENIVMGSGAELGPLDPQAREHDEYVPALDKVKALERLHASALEALDRTMALLLLRSRRDIDTLLPLALDFTAKMMRPLLEKTDMLDYTKMSRVLKIAEDYAIRLLERNYEAQESDEGVEMEENSFGDFSLLDYDRLSKRKAVLRAQHLAGAYPDHAFAIDAEEARRIGLQIVERSTEKNLQPTLDRLHEILADQAQKRLIAIGKVILVEQLEKVKDGP